ncbi:cation:proton antiporter [Lichenifustis flavocetrariae]|uniref:Cation:proton antiporter n=1 Tax=Lichenifustis flavocetrariae TaxID=2949735 RepID=A0AA42CPN1_9HYPH|nr:cation:proton antiporter [Lichenifustis flavocetrariae]MCW6510565.1 cation:proton antiporter [Lichenifustis flavocetrariae]
MHDLVFDIAVCTVTAWTLAVAAQAIGQPVILAYLIGGFVIGPSGFRLVSSEESIATISELGLIFLLFMIGLEIDLRKIIRSGPVILVAALAQIGGCCLLGIFFFLYIGLPLGGGHWDALYLGVAAALSSTVIIVKVLYDKRELDTLPGRITLGVLVLQDLFVILFLAIQPSLNDLRAEVIVLSILRVGVLVASALLVSRFILPVLFFRIARLPELVLVGALAWCLALGQLAELLHLSREMGALVAGVSLSTFPYALDVAAKVTSLRDFFVTLFFVGVGMTIPIPSLDVFGFAAVLVVFTVASRLVTIIPPLYALRQGLRTSLLPAINLSQLSEFSLVLLQIGVAAGHVAPAVKAATSISFVVLAAISTFGMGRSDALVRGAIAALKRLGLRDLDGEMPLETVTSEHGARIMLLGFFRTASSLIAELEARQSASLADVAVVDFNPVVHRGLMERGIKVAYGDISQPETLIHAGVRHAEVLICTVPDFLLKGVTNERLVRQLRSLNPTATILAPAELISDVDALYAAGADYVMVTRLTEASQLCDVLEAIDDGLLSSKRESLAISLKDRREVLA